MGERAREALALRAVVVSGRAALAKTTDIGDRERIHNTVTELLAHLGADVIRDGADPEILRQIEEARAAVWD
jgi:hypothetical protein